MQDIKQEQEKLNSFFEKEFGYFLLSNKPVSYSGCSTGIRDTRILKKDGASVHPLVPILSNMCVQLQGFSDLVD
jgi:hypothetical protein